MKEIVKNALIIGLAVFLTSALFPAVSFAASVSAECAYTDADLVCYIYVDTSPDSLISGGVKLLYDTDKLDTPAVTKNNTDWYFGAGTSEYAYMDPEITENPPQGEVVYIVGKLDTNDDPQVGVNGTSVLVGTATFARKTADDLSGEQGVFFGISSILGRTTGSFVNFVDTSGTDLDGSATFTSTVVERGDANGDGNINVGDYIAVRNNMGSTDFAPYVDCNNDGAINVGDYICVRNKKP